MLGFTDGLVRLFASRRSGVATLRDAGLLLFDLVPPAKRATVGKPAPVSARQNTAAGPAVVVTGQLQLAISPWGQVEVDGTPAGTTPPLTRLTLPEGSHTVTVRNEDFAPHTITVQVSADKPVTVRHRFGP